MRTRLHKKTLSYSLGCALVSLLTTVQMPLRAAILGDRLVLAVNNTPYSQLQIEGYTNVKEALRSDPSKSQVVSGSNWNIALAAFMLDMSIYQEAIKSSGFRPQKEGVDKTLQLVKTELLKNPPFQKRFQELGLDDAAIREHLARVLTIENIRRSRRSAESVKDSKWEEVIQKSAIIRWFDKGKVYEEITPLASTQASAPK